MKRLRKKILGPKCYLLFSLLLLSRFGYSQTTIVKSDTIMADSVSTDSSKAQRNYFGKMPKLNPPKINGTISYQYFYNDNYSPPDSSMVLNIPQHFVTGEIKSTVQNIPILARFVYDPSQFSGNQFKYNFSFDKEAFSNGLEEKYKKNKNKYRSYQDSLLQTNLETSLQKQIAELKYATLIDSFQTKYKLDTLNQFISNDSITQFTDTSKMSLDSLMVDSSNYYQDLEQLNKLEEQIEFYEDKLTTVSTIFKNDSLLQRNAQKYDLRKIANIDSLMPSQYLTKGENILNSIKTFQFGTISPVFSKPSTYRATLTGIDVDYNISNHVNVHIFGGWDQRVSYQNISKALKSGGVKLSSEIVSTVKGALSFIHNYKGKQYYSELISPGINNSIIGLSLSSKLIKIMEVGIDLNYSNNYQEPNSFKYSFTTNLKDKLAYNLYSKIKSSKTKSTLFIEFSGRNREFKNYLTPFQLPNSKEYRLTYSQQLFKSKLISRVSFFNRETQSLEFSGFQNSLNSINLDLRTRWQRYPNFNVIFSENKNIYSVPNLYNSESRSILAILGVNYMHRIKKVKIFGEFQYQYRLNVTNSFSYRYDRLRLLFRLKSELWTWSFNSSKSTKSLNSTFSLSNNLRYIFNQSFQLGMVNRFISIRNYDNYANGINISGTFKKNFTIQMEGLALNSNQNTSWGYNLSIKVLYRL